MRVRRKATEDDVFVWADVEDAVGPRRESPSEFRIKWDPSWNVAPPADRVQAVLPAGSPVAVLEPPDRSVGRSPATRVRLGDLLVERGLITPAQLDLALAEHALSGARLGSEVVRLGMVSERDLIEALAEQLGEDIVDLRTVEPAPDAVSRLAEATARRLETVPLRMVDGVLEVALADVLTDSLRAELEAAAGCSVTGVLAPPAEIRAALDRAYVVIREVKEHVATFRETQSRKANTGTARFAVDERAPIVQVVSLLLTQAVRDRASDIHIEPHADKVRVRFRIDGVMREVVDLPESMAQSLVSRLKVMAEMNIVERRRSQDGQIGTEIDGRPLDIRVSTMSTVFGEKAVLRLLDKTRSLKSLSELGMTRAVGDAVVELVSSPFGMVVCAGPTGSGKTTTLYAAMKSIDLPTRNITTIEDPVEYVVPTINQIQVNEQAGVSFSNGLRTILRQDPDVILVGEIRDVETARIAVQSALTGHLVLSSVHSTDSAMSIQRFRDMGIEPFLITSSVLAVLSQRLVRRICSHCRTEYSPSAAQRRVFKDATGIDKEVFVQGAGCNLCSHTGHAQRVGVFELLRVSDAVRELIVGDAGHVAIRAQARSEGMRTLQDEVFRLVAEDVTTMDEAARTVFAH